MQDGGLDVVAMFDMGGTGSTARVVGEWTYDAYGEPIARWTNGGISEPHAGHKGLFFDRLDAGVADPYSGAETPRLVQDAVGHYHVRNRVLSPKLGRWLQTDPNATGATLLQSSACLGLTLRAGVPTALNIVDQTSPVANRYGYIENNPADRFDPLGLFTQKDGYAVEWAVQNLYAKDHPNCSLLLGRPSSILGINVRPDIVNFTQHSWLEVKPMSASGVIKAAAQTLVYNDTFGHYGFLPDSAWNPSTHLVYANGEVFEIMNLGGIVFYADAGDALEDVMLSGAGAYIYTAIKSKAAMNSIGRAVIQLLLGDSSGMAGVSAGVTSMETGDVAFGEAVGCATSGF
jgi:hypothetical protein